MASYGTNIRYALTDPTGTPGPGEDILVQNQANGKLWYFNHTTWVDLTAGGGGGGNGIYGGSGTVPGSTVATLTDTMVFDLTTTSSQAPLQLNVNNSATTPLGLSTVVNGAYEQTMEYGPISSAYGTIPDGFFFSSITSPVTVRGTGYTQIGGDNIELNGSRVRISGPLEQGLLTTSVDATVTNSAEVVHVKGHSGTVTLTIGYTPSIPTNYTRRLLIRNVGGTHNVNVSRGTQIFKWLDMSGTISVADFTVTPGREAILTWDESDPLNKGFIVRVI